MWVKICGITSVEDAELAISSGADAIGLNLVLSSPRVVSEAVAREIAKSAAGRVEVVGVIADRSLFEASRLREELGLSLLQLHGDEAPSDLEALLPRAFKAVRIASEADASAAAGFGGERLLVDAKVSGKLGGTGVQVDTRLVRKLVASRKVVLAGGLTPDNVAAVVREVQPWGVDVASGVEIATDARTKDPSRLAAFVRRAREP